MVRSLRGNKQIWVELNEQIYEILPNIQLSGCPPLTREAQVKQTNTRDQHFTSPAKHNIDALLTNGVTNIQRFLFYSNSTARV